MTGPQVFELPDLGEGLSEAEVVRWLVSVGDEVAVDQPVVEVETAKSVVEVPTPYAGRVVELHGAEGSMISVGAPLVSVAAEQPVQSYREEERAGSGNVLVGYGTQDDLGAARRRARKRAVAAPAAVNGTENRVLRVASPLVRRLAREAGVVLRDVTGSGPDGLITRRDVEAVVRTGVRRPAPAPADGTTRVPMTGVQRAAAGTLSRSRREIPEATVWVDVDFTELFRMRDQAKRTGGSPPSLLGLLARLTVASLRRFPELNGIVDTERAELVQYHHVHLGLAVQTDRGLLAPAVLNAHRLTTGELDAEIRRLLAAARDGAATPEELSAGTFTLNNYGSFNVDGSAAIINHPQVAILGVGRIIDRPWVVDGELAVRKIGQLSFVFDHRVCDGARAAGFIRSVADAIESPAHAFTLL